ncbi:MULTISPECIES: family 2 encapsulin nanocompartment cargo protein terpene cyclase [unclassified Streptomyces]|uniref:family 2 encapsulin nanocompartment cargo protein terpene cyclase n=1 Tax=unclassified Streptomyces TaxID=2593676 RepID=UPI00225A8F8D|nr:MULTISPECIES: family 2 encapsulin nanocompartment cargo protein terpene cyclase [unclassified Streptomyces]MCX4524653.1 family 2 encapsulin nanocompartment cargo protein terpene cyclase [Streptomyces sp. NBC_01551]MCX4544839.1 family 2 encapsulin nanocompartment cargo protein terpene cyclase [Streptomyces sp. NBC_01565]
MQTHPPASARSRAALLERLRGGPAGFGTASLRVPPASLRVPPAARPGANRRPGSGGGGGNGEVPELYCPPALREHDALAREIDDRLIEWAEHTGLYEGRLDDVRALSLGRYFVLAFAHVHDPDRLLAPAKCTLAQWASDDYYCDDDSAGADPLRIATNLSLANAAVDPAYLPARYAPGHEDTLRADPVLVAFRSSAAHLKQYATWSQITRYRHELAALWSGYTAEAGWRVTGRTPSVQEFLTVRQDNSFLPVMVMLDAAGGYELPVETYGDPRVRGAVLKAASAGVVVNDLYSMRREEQGTAVSYNLPSLIQAEDGCTREEAVRRSADIHDELVHAFEDESAALAAAGFPPLTRYLADVWAWLGGNLEWHRTSARYHAEPATGSGPTQEGTPA